MKAQKELPDSMALAIIVCLIIGTLFYFVYGQWQRLQSVDNLAANVNAEQVAEKMAKERETYRAVMNGEKSLAEADGEAASQSTVSVKTAAASAVAGVSEKTGKLSSSIEQYSCGQKQECSQMKSCAEAKFYARQCSGSKIVPDKNGNVCPELCNFNKVN